MIQLQKHHGADKSRHRPPIIVPSLRLSSLHPPTSAPQRTLCRGSDSSPPLMLARMNVKSLRASSAHPQWETLQEESSMSEPILARLPSHRLRSLLFVFVLSSFALLPWGVTNNWPFICKREKKWKHPCWFQKKKSLQHQPFLNPYSSLCLVCSFSLYVSFLLLFASGLRPRMVVLKCDVLQSDCTEIIFWCHNFPTENSDTNSMWLELVDTLSPYIFYTRL